MLNPRFFVKEQNRRMFRIMNVPKIVSALAYYNKAIKVDVTKFT